MNFIDISADLARCTVYPGDPETKISAVRMMAAGDECNLAQISMGLHNGTHSDAPLHFIQDGTSIEKMPLDSYIGECCVVEVPEGPITGEYVDFYFPLDEKRILVKGSGKAWFLESAAEELAFRGVKLIGIDALSVGVHGNQVKPHQAFLRDGVAILEGLNLENVKAGHYYLVAPPVKIGGAEAAPVRAVLMTDYIFWGGYTPD